jgi:hypothetical protein
MTQPNDRRQFGGRVQNDDQREEIKIDLETRKGVQRRIVFIPRPSGTWLLREETHQGGQWRTDGCEIVEHLSVSGLGD